MGHEDYREMLAAHALGALDPPEARALEAHLETCGHCRAELEVWHETAAALAFSARPEEPSDGLRDSVLRAARQLGQPAQALPSKRAGARSDERREASSPEASPETQNVLPFERPAPRKRWGAASVAGALAASVLLAVLVASLYVVWGRYRRTQEQLSALTGRLTRTEQELAREREEKAMLASPQALSMMLAGTNMAPQARAKLTFDRGTGRAMLFADGLPPAPAGKAYQLWFIAGTHVMPGGVFKPDAQGRAVAHDQVPAEARGSAVFAVTLEPQGGVPAPTGEKYLLSAAS